jgi:hypothetical protein
LSFQLIEWRRRHTSTRAALGRLDSREKARFLPDLSDGFSEKIIRFSRAENRARPVDAKNQESRSNGSCR